ADPLGWLPHNIKFNCRRHLKPCFSCCHASCHIRTSHSGGESSQSSVSACMRVCSDNHVPCNCQSLFRKKGMLDSHLSHIEIVCDIMATGKFPDAFTMLC